MGEALMQICIKRHGEFVDVEENESYVNELLLFASFKFKRWQQRSFKKWRYDALPRYTIKFTWFEFQCGLDHRWVTVCQRP